jgi:hypothetical protein
MATFDQRHQQVNYQYNAAGDINLGAVASRADLLRELEHLKAEVSRAAAAQLIEPEQAADVEYHITKAKLQAERQSPDKQGMMKSLAQASEVVSSVPAAAAALSGLVNALAQAAQQVQLHF